MAPAPGLEIIEVDEPGVKPGQVKIRVARGSICGTDLHIANWDPWASKRIVPPRIIGHEFCGEIVEIGEGVTGRRLGEFVASESHVVCGHCKQCLAGEGHVCIDTYILGVDVDGGFAPFAVIPAINARPVPSVVPRRVASMLDALGNAVHTVMDGPVEGRTILITGLGPIGLFAAAICKCLGAAKIYATEVSPFRLALAEKVGVHVLLNPGREDVSGALCRLEPDGVDATLEMSGHPSSLPLAIEHTRAGGRVSLLGVFPDFIQDFDFNQVIFKGLNLHGIVGRKIWETWDQMSWLLTDKGLDIDPIITHEMPARDVNAAMDILRAGNAGKIVLDFGD